VGDPSKLTVKKFEGYLSRVQDLLDVINPDLASDPISRSKTETQRLLDAGDPKTWALYED
jgi:hypothetical protein